MGVYVLGRCYETQSDAYDALYSSVLPTISSNGCMQSLTKANSVWSLTVQCDDVTTSYELGAISGVSCSAVDSVADGVTLGFAVAFVWISAYVIKVLTRAL